MNFESPFYNASDEAAFASLFASQYDPWFF